MMRSLLIICCTLSIHCLLAQDSFQWADYRARYERRVQMTASLYYQSPNYSNDLLSQGVSLPFRWKLARNLDRRQLNFAISTNVGLQWGRQDEKAGFQIYIYPYLEERRYSGAFFYGSRTSMSVSQVNSHAYNLDFAPKLLLGWGRLENAEDALLAHWMVEALPLGATATAMTSDLAHTITDLIGNRTFDERRRRTYELAQLAQYLDLTNLDARDQLYAYSALNDNWAFANRLAIQHGWQIKFETGFSFKGHPHRNTLLKNIQYFFGEMELVYATTFPETKINLRTSWNLILNVPYPVHDSFGQAVRLYPLGEARVELLYFPNSRHLLRAYATWSGQSSWIGDTWSETISRSQNYNTQLGFEWNLLLDYPWSLQVRSGWGRSTQYALLSPDSKSSSIFLSINTTYAFQ